MNDVSQSWRPRVAYVTSLYPAASHTFIQREVAGLEALGFDILPCSIREPGPEHLIGREEEDAHVKTFYVLKHAKKFGNLPKALGRAFTTPRRFFQTLGLAWRTAPPGFRGGVKQCFYLAEALLLARRLQDTQVDHIHNHFADHSANLSLLTASLTGIPFSYTLHGPNELYEVNKWYFAEKTARAKFVVCISHFARSQAMYFSDPMHWHKLRIVHCGVEPARYERPKSEDNSQVKLLYVGRLTPIKGLRVLIEAFADVVDQNGSITLDIIGDGDDRVFLEERAASLKGKVNFLGYQSQERVAAALAEADMLILPSYAEGLPVVLMEALASATPVICSQVAGVGELVENGKSGFTVPAGDAETLKDRILALAADPDLRRAFGAHGQARVKEEFDVAIEAARIGALFADEGGDALRPHPLSSKN